MNVQVISFKCVLKNNLGTVISSTFNRDVLTAGQPDQTAMLSGLTKGLQNLVKGEKRSIALSAEEAYGLYDPKKVVFFPRKKIPNSTKKGEVINILSKSGIPRSYKVLELHSDFVSLDGNHPLAGQDLIFEIEALDARDATTDEINESANVVANQLLN
ncbi:MAG: FKBP-type peptidyl-prolyl cis-trans isomerase [Bdellovibrionaceae bacterium]|nr:FKBP-type peptidyl-prolyl cis-trans isomerase [Pseudobdellovibrionaceae bacterium]